MSSINVSASHVGFARGANEDRMRRIAAGTASRIAPNESGLSSSNGWRDFGAFQLNRFTSSCNFVRGIFIDTTISPGDTV